MRKPACTKRHASPPTRWTGGQSAPGSTPGLPPAGSRSPQPHRRFVYGARGVEPHLMDPRLRFWQRNFIDLTSRLLPTECAHSSAS